MWSSFINKTTTNVSSALNNAWESDDEDENYDNEGEEDDLHDIAVNDDRLEEEEENQQQQQQEEEERKETFSAAPPPPLPSEPAQGGGGGLLIGRFTRFIEQVTQADAAADEEDYNNNNDSIGQKLGWQDGDPSLGLDDSHNVGDVWQEDDVDLDVSDTAEQPKPEQATGSNTGALQPTIRLMNVPASGLHEDGGDSDVALLRPAVDVDVNASGWHDDDEDFDFSEQPLQDDDEPLVDNRDEQLQSPINDAAARIEHDVQRLADPGSPTDAAVSGWQDDDDDDLDFSEEKPSAVASGWKEDDGDLDFSDALQEVEEKAREFAGDRVAEHPRTAPAQVVVPEPPLSPVPNRGIVMVDHTPPVTPQLQSGRATVQIGGTAAAGASNKSVGSLSLIALAESEDLTRDTGGNASSMVDQEEIYDDENELDYGPVVDQTPTKRNRNKGNTTRPAPMSRQNSLAVQADTVAEEDDDELGGDGWGDDEDLSLPHIELVQPPGADPSSSPAASPVVDHTPNDPPVDNESVLGRSRNLSVGVLASESESLTARLPPTSGEEEDLLEQFGPMVDHTPLATTDSVKSAVATISGTNSLAVQALTLEQDYQEDDAMDETLFGDSTIDGGAWEQDNAELDEELLDTCYKLSLAEVQQQEAEEQEEARHQNIHHPVAKKVSGDDKHMVDHTPDDDQDVSGGEGKVATEVVDPSVVVVVAQEDISRDTGTGNDDEDVYDDENEMDFGPVVDLTPTTQNASQNQSTSTSPTIPSGTNNSMAVQAGQLYEDMQEDDAMDDTAFGGDTTTKDDDGWEQDDDIALDDDLIGVSKGPLERNEELKLNGVAMVDHTPSEMGSPPLKVNDASVDVLDSVSPKDTDSAEGDEFGPVVDQTPTTPAHPNAPRSDSVVVQVHDLDTVDETYGDEEAEEDGGDTVDLEMPLHFRSHDAPPVVDYIPNRPESRFGDASTMVAAELSEVLSVDDMAQEEGNFGPVVDVTPPTGPVPAAAVSPSAAESVAANSTAVFAPPSVAADDLDGDEETVTRGEQSAWENQEEAPNPQSGNDEPASRVNEQLVDFLPPPGELETTDHGSSLEGREPSSELTVGGAQSLLQPLDPKEDDFGPVVDLTPTPRSAAIPRSGQSVASTATQVTASECRALEKEDITESATEDLDQIKAKVVVDNLPHSQVRFPMDSTGSVLGSQLAEDEEEDDSKFGPVVDHLPTPRASLAPSRGGSTVDALATVSEVDSDDDDGGDGWDDDIDVSESGVSDRSALQKAAALRLAFRRPAGSEHERNVSVRFEPTVDDRGGGGRSSEGLNQTQYFDPEISASAPTEDTQYFDPSSGGDSAWGDGVPTRGSPEPDTELSTKSFAEADTPPSTPYRRPETASIQPRPEMLEEGQIGFQCESCLHAKTVECPCIQRLLQINTIKGPLIGTLITPEGKSVQVDFSKLLQDEMAKRMLVEKESEALRSAAELQTIDRALSESKESEFVSTIATLQEDKESLQQTVARLQAAMSSIENEREAIKDELDSSRQSLSEAEQKKSNWSARESALEAQVSQLKGSLESATSKLVSDNSVADMMTSLQSELASKSGQCEELNSQIMQLQLRWEEAERQKTSQQQMIDHLSLQLQQTSSEYQQNIAGLSHQLKEIHDLSHDKTESDSVTIANLKEDVHRLSIAKEDLLKTIGGLHQQHEKEMQQQFDLLDKKTAEIRSLETAAKSFETEKPRLLAEIARQRSFAEQSEALATELLSVAKERDILQSSLEESKDAVAHLQKLIDEHGMEQVAIESRRDAEIMSLKSELANGAKALRCKESEVESLSARLRRQEQEKEESERSLQELRKLHQLLEVEEAQARRAYEEEQLKSSKALNKITLLESQISQLTANVQHIESERDKSISHLSSQVQSLEQEKEASLRSLQEVKELHQSLEIEASQARAAHEEVKGKLMTALNEVASLQGQVSQLEAQCQILGEGKEEAVRSLQQLENSYHALEAEVDQARATCEEQQGKYSRALDEVASLQSQVSQLTAEVKRVESEREKSESQKAALCHTLTKEKEEALSSLQQLQKLYQSLQVEAKQARIDHEEAQEKCRTALDESTSLQHQLSQLEVEVQKVEAERKKSLSHLAALGRTLERAEKEAKTQAARSAELELLVDSMKSDLASVIALRDDLESQRDQLVQRCREVEVNASKELEAAGVRMHQESKRFRQEIESLVANQEAVAEELKAKTSSVGSLESERDSLATRCRELENQLIRAREQAEIDLAHQTQKHHEIVDELRHHMQQLEEQLTEQRRAGEIMISERNNLLSRCRQLESRSKESYDESSRRLQDMSHSHELRLAELRDENTHLAKRLHEFSMSHGDLADLRGDVERLKKDHEVLTEENEELLVQLALMKEQVDGSEEQIRVLQEEVVARDDLIGRVDEENAQLSSEIERLKAELNFHLEEKPRLEQAIERLQAKDRDGVTLHEATMAEHALRNAEGRIQQLEDHCRKQQIEIESLRHDQHASFNQASARFEQMIQQLELACASKDQELNDRGAEISELKSKLDVAETKRLSAEQSTDEKNRRILELESLYEESEDQLGFARDQLAAATATMHAESRLSSFEAAIKDLENKETHANDAIADYEQRMKELEADLNQKNLMVSRLESSVSELQFQLDAGQSLASLHLSRDLGPVLEDSDKDSEIQCLKQQLETVTDALHSTRLRLTEKESEFDRLREELSQLNHVKAELERAKAHLQVPESAVSQGETKSSDTEIDSLRSHIVSLAVALERSETKRAEAISRLMSERESNVRSLKRLSESVKRYYHHVSAGDV